MKIYKKLVLSLAMIAALGAINSSAVAGMKEKQYQVNHVERLTRKLELTEQQSDKLNQLISKYSSNEQRVSKEQMKKKHQQHRAALEVLLSAPNFDEQTVREKMAQRNKQHQDKMVNRMKLKHAIYQMLNPNQQEQYLKLLAHRMNKMKKRG